MLPALDAAGAKGEAAVEDAVAGLEAAGRSREDEGTAVRLCQLKSSNMHKTGLADTELEDLNYFCARGAGGDEQTPGEARPAGGGCAL